MNSNQWHNQTSPGEIHRSPNRIIGFFLHFLLPIAALTCGVIITVYLMKTSPEAKPRNRPPTATLVEVQSVVSGPQQTVIHAMGEIVPAREIDLKPRVSGEVIGLSEEFLPGGYFAEGQTILKIDPVDYTLVVQQLESEEARAESDLLLEMGNQRIAEKELALLNEPVSAEEQTLILRKPQLEKLEATRVFARARLAKAQLDLQRTEIKAPFNTVIGTRNVDKGARVTESTILAHLIGSDKFWLKLTLPVEQLKWVDVPTSRGEEGSLVRIYSQGDDDLLNHRIGRVIRLAASLEEKGRMAQLLVEIDDPLSRRQENSDKPKLLLGSYVRAEVEGTGIDAGVSIDRGNIHDGGNVWLMDEDGLLDIRKVSITFRNRDQVIIRDGIDNGERIVTSSLSSPIAGIPLRLAGNVDEKAQQQNDPGDVPDKGQRRLSRAQ